MIKRDNNRSAVFSCDEDYRRYRQWLGEAATEYGLKVHVYVLMTNHVHRLAPLERPESLPRTHLRAQPRARRYGRASALLSLVELARQRAGRRDTLVSPHAL